VGVVSEWVCGECVRGTWEVLSVSWVLCGWCCQLELGVADVRANQKRKSFIRQKMVFTSKIVKSPPTKSHPEAPYPLTHQPLNDVTLILST